MTTRPFLIRYGWLVLFFTVGVIALGALVRATGSGAGCGRSWPTCRGELLPPLEGATAVEFTHRAASGLALLLVIAFAVAVFRSVAKGHPARMGAGLSVVAIVGEALIGAMLVLAEWVGDDVSAARAVAVPLHLVNTLFLLASLTLTLFWLGGGRRLTLSRDRAVRRAVVLGGVALVLIFATGAVTALADTLFPKDGLGADFSTEAHFLTRLRIVHPILALTAAATGWWLAARGEPSKRTAAKWMPVLVGLMLLSGVLSVLLGVPIWMQMVHLLLADSLWVAYVWVSATALQAGAPVPVTP
ncbi:MAG: COX15/CtaA family protein [Acidimicrobiia bacterium]